MHFKIGLWRTAIPGTAHRTGFSVRLFGERDGGMGCKGAGAEREGRVSGGAVVLPPDFHVDAVGGVGEAEEEGAGGGVPGADGGARRGADRSATQIAGRFAVYEHTRGLAAEKDAGDVIGFRGGLAQVGEGAGGAVEVVGAAGGGEDGRSPGGFAEVVEESLGAGCEFLARNNGERGIEQVNERSFQDVRLIRDAFVQRGGDLVGTAVQQEVVLPLQGPYSDSTADSSIASPPAVMTYSFGSDRSTHTHPLPQGYTPPPGCGSKPSNSNRWSDGAS